MDVAKTLIRSVVRAFYETKHVLVIDAVLLHSALPYDELSWLLHMQPKDLRKLCGGLRENRLLTVYTQSRPESREGMQRPINKEYLYIDFHATIDAIKYKVYHLTEKVKELYKPIQEKKDYFCPTCRAQWTQFEVLDKVGPMGFECHRCGGVLEREANTDGDSTGHEKQKKLAIQLKGFIDMLKQIDSLEIPSNTFEDAMALRIVVETDRGSNTTVPVQDLSKKSSGKSRGSNQAQPAVEFSLITNTETTAEQKAAEEKKKAQLAIQNALPEWHTKSTVSGDSLVAAPKASDMLTNGTNLVKKEEEEKNVDAEEDDDVAEYYEQLRREREREEQEDDGGLDDEDDFEDVLEADASQIGTPADSFDVKQSDIDKKSSGSGTPAGLSPSILKGTQSGDSEGEPVSKKVKFEEMANGVKTGASGAATPASDEDDDEYGEFEDVK